MEAASQQGDRLQVHVQAVWLRFAVRDVNLIGHAVNDLDHEEFADQARIAG